MEMIRGQKEVRKEKERDREREKEVNRREDDTHVHLTWRERIPSCVLGQVKHVKLPYHCLMFLIISYREREGGGGM